MIAHGRVVGGETYEEDSQCPSPAGFCVLLAQRDQLLRQSLGLLGLGPCRRDGLMLEEGGDEVAEEGLSMRRLPAEMAVFGRAAGHTDGM